MLFTSSNSVGASSNSGMEHQSGRDSSPGNVIDEKPKGWSYIKLGSGLAAMGLLFISLPRQYVSLGSIAEHGDMLNGTPLHRRRLPHTDAPELPKMPGLSKLEYKDLFLQDAPVDCNNAYFAVEGCGDCFVTCGCFLYNVIGTALLGLPCLVCGCFCDENMNTCFEKQKPRNTIRGVTTEYNNLEFLWCYCCDAPCGRTGYNWCDNESARLATFNLLKRKRETQRDHGLTARLHQGGETSRFRTFYDEIKRGIRYEKNSQSYNEAKDEIKSEIADDTIITVKNLEAIDRYIDEILKAVIDLKVRRDLALQGQKVISTEKLKNLENALSGVDVDFHYDAGTHDFTVTASSLFTVKDKVTNDLKEAERILRRNEFGLAPRRRGHFDD